MSEYSTVRTGKLKLKGAAGASYKKKKKGKRKHGHQEDGPETEPGLIKHSTTYHHIAIAIVIMAVRAITV